MCVSQEAPVSCSLFISGIHADDRARVDGAHKRALDPLGDGDFDIEYRTVGLEDRVERWVAAKGQTFAENGRAVRFVGTFLEITAKKIVEQERAALLAREQEARAEAESARARAEAASRAKDEFLATVSHELRNPLNAILGWSRVLLEEGEDLSRERTQKGLEVIARNARAQVQLAEVAAATRPSPIPNDASASSPWWPRGRSTAPGRPPSARRPRPAPPTARQAASTPASRGTCA